MEYDIGSEVRLRDANGGRAGAGAEFGKVAQTPHRRGKVLDPETHALLGPALGCVAVLAGSQAQVARVDCDAVADGDPLGVCGIGGLEDGAVIGVDYSVTGRRGGGHAGADAAVLVVFGVPVLPDGDAATGSHGGGGWVSCKCEAIAERDVMVKGLFCELYAQLEEWCKEEGKEEAELRNGSRYLYHFLILSRECRFC